MPSLARGALEDMGFSKATCTGRVYRGASEVMRAPNGGDLQPLSNAWT
jgi:hypothetical protein